MSFNDKVEEHLFLRSFVIEEEIRRVNSEIEKLLEETENEQEDIDKLIEELSHDEDFCECIELVQVSESIKELAIQNNDTNLLRDLKFRLEERDGQINEAIEHLFRLLNICN